MTTGMQINSERTTGRGFYVTVCSRSSCPRREYSSQMSRAYNAFSPQLKHDLNHSNWELLTASLRHSLGWLGSRVVSVLDSGAERPGFKSQSRRCRETLLGKRFTPTVLCSPSSKIGSSPLKGCGGDCRPGGK